MEITGGKGAPISITRSGFFNFIILFYPGMLQLSGYYERKIFMKIIIQSIMLSLLAFCQALPTLTTKARVTKRSLAALSPEPGQSVWVQVKSASVME
ncbi:MAG: hypothetical protein EHM79_13520 [Geobacter sp.]|nr:MAG: hypothetical protein EHM79_13520 [Geobacter sp.]